MNLRAEFALLRMSISISLVEDERDTRVFLAALIDRTDGLRCVAAYPNAETALKGIHLNPPDVLLMDLNLPRLSGVECVRQLKPRLPRLKILMLTKYEDADHIFQALRAGADGYLLKRKIASHLLQAIQEVRRGGAPFSSEVAACVLAFFHEQGKCAVETAALTPRERQVLDLLAKGYLYKEIAAKLGIGLQTVNGYIKSIYEKLHVHSRAEAVAKYFAR